MRHVGVATMVNRNVNHVHIPVTHTNGQVDNPSEQWDFSPLILIFSQN